MRSAMGAGFGILARKRRILYVIKSVNYRKVCNVRVFGLRQPGHVLYDGQTDVQPAVVRHHEHRVDAGLDLAVHESHLEFVLKIRNGPQAAQKEII